MTFPRSPRSVLAAAVCVLAAGSVVSGPAAATPKASAAKPVTTTYSKPGKHQFTVPKGVRSMKFEFVGAGGGGGGGGTAPGTNGTRGGSGGGGGARVVCTVAIQPGTKLTIDVRRGGAGGRATQRYKDTNALEKGAPGGNAMFSVRVTSPGNAFSAGAAGGMGGNYALDHRTVYESGVGLGLGGDLKPGYGGAVGGCFARGKRLPGGEFWKGANGAEGRHGNGGGGGKGGVHGNAGAGLPGACPAGTGKGGDGGRGGIRRDNGDKGTKGGDSCAVITYTPAA
ncbi:hypothetical protein AB0I22_33265 [Streptomyces sp. NPDC050610]|uniref:glycine-rich domain-containing protein n=1 Tax=Streptomyces sp. NPDC050610 TaxID=3157097 RepID=UPI00343BB6DB